jgi:hypothetical protein
MKSTKGGKAMSAKKKATDSANGKRKFAKPANGKKKSTKPANDLLPGEKADIREEAASLIPWWEEWLDTPHAMLGAQRPNDLIGTKYEQSVRDILRMIKYGIPT